MLKKDNPVPSIDETLNINIQITALTKDEIPFILKELILNLENNSWGFEYKLKVLQNGVETNKEQPKEKNDYWMIYTKKKGFIKTKFSTEDLAIEKAKEIEGKDWEENTEFFEYNWVKPRKGFYDEYSYNY
jgi:hypothetical protein